MPERPILINVVDKGGRGAIRRGKWKLLAGRTNKYPDGARLPKSSYVGTLFDLESDPFEKTNVEQSNLLSQTVQGDVVLSALMMSHDTIYQSARTGLFMSPQLEGGSSLTVTCSPDPNEGIKVVQRKNSDGQQQVLYSRPGRTPCYVRMVKTQNQIVVSLSPTGQHNWQTVAVAETNLGERFQAGAAVDGSPDKARLVRLKDLEVHKIGTQTKLLWHDLDHQLSISGKRKVKIGYEAAAPMDININIQHTKIWKGLGEIELSYEAPEGLDPDHIKAMGTESPYRWMISIRPEKSHWKQTIESTLVAVEDVVE